jgi:hypothetical protein
VIPKLPELREVSVLSSTIIINIDQHVLHEAEGPFAWLDKNC